MVTRRMAGIALSVAALCGCGESFENAGAEPESVTDLQATSIAAANGAAFLATPSGAYAVLGGSGVLTAALTYPSAVDVVRSEDSLYWLVELEDTPFLIEQPFDGSPPGDVDVGLTPAMIPRDIAVGRFGRVAVVHQPADMSGLISGVQWVDTSSGDITTPVVDTYVKGIAIGASTVYICAFEGDVRRYDSGDWVTLNVPTGICNAIAADDEFVYWLEEGQQLRVMRAAHNDPIPVELAVLSDGVAIANGHLAQDDVNLYFAGVYGADEQRGHDAILAVSKGGGAPRVLTSRAGLFMTGPIGVDFTHAYFGALGGVMRVPK